MNGFVCNSMRQTADHRSQGGQLPSFIIIGAMKSGTTTLDQYLRRHPDVFMCQPKEPGFFSRDERFERGIEWYKGLFLRAGPEQVCGEASTCYTRSASYPAAAERLAEAVPEAKLIYIMRHPVERAYSHYVHAMTRRFLRTRQPPIPFCEALETMPSIIRSSCYIDEIKRYLRFFARPRLLPVTLDDLRSAPVRVLQDVQRHIGVAPIDLMERGELIANPAGQPIAHRYASERIAEVRASTFGRVVARVLPHYLRQTGRHWLGRVFMRSDDAARRTAEFKRTLGPLTPELRKEVMQQLECPTRELEQFLGRDLAGWRS